MTKFAFAIDDVARAIARADSVDALQSCLPKIRDLFSLKHVAYQAWLEVIPPAPPTLNLSTFPLDWSKEYESRHVGEWDPIAKAARQSVLPIDWESVDWTTPDAYRYRLMLERHDAGFPGLTVPVHGPRCDAALISFASSSAGKATWPALRRQYEADMTILALKVHDRALSLARTLDAKRNVCLTPKVKACLELLAQGRKPAEIGTQLGLSVHTVRKHLDRAVNDLSCQTKAQAITRALSLGLIRLRSAAASHLYPLCIIPMAINSFP